MNIEFYLNGIIIKKQVFDNPPRRDDYILLSGQLFFVNAICHNVNESGAVNYEVYLKNAPQRSES